MGRLEIRDWEIGDYFPDDAYHTPEDTPRGRMLLGSRVTFFAGFWWRVFGSWRLVRHGRYNADAWATSTFGLLRHIEACGGRFHITGLDHLRQPGPFVIISNHMSSLETAVMPVIIAPIRPITFVAKSSLLKYPFFGPVIAATDPILVDRVNPRQDFERVMSQGADMLTAGVSVVVFPQSTRTADFDPHTFNSLGIKLAKKARVRVIPTALKTDFWGTGKYLKDFGPIHRDRPIHMAFGAPFHVGTDAKQAHQQAVEFIQTHLGFWE
jgi:1-acyl-sn-glycerol-3-phosphate acyltransferase